jgi:hypothetical protein
VSAVSASLCLVLVLQIVLVPLEPPESEKEFKGEEESIDWGRFHCVESTFEVELELKPELEGRLAYMVVKDDDE